MSQGAEEGPVFPLGPPAEDGAAGGRRKAARQALLRTTGLAVSPALFRLWAGRWPTWAESAEFARGLTTQGAGLSVLPRAVCASEAAERQLSAILLQRLIAAGRLPAFAAHGPTAQSGNPLAYWEGPPIAFFHFEKTGGSALVATLAQSFHPMQIAGDASFTGGRRGAAQVAAADMRLRRRSFLWGHFALDDLRAGAPAHVLLTMLREPRARILSLYYFWRSIRPEHVAGLEDPRVEAAQACSRLEFLRLRDAAVLDAIDNVYVRRLASAGMRADGTDPLETAPDAMARRAMAALQMFSWVGLTHRFDAGLAALSAMLGETLETPPAYENTRAKNHEMWPLLYRKVDAPPLNDAEEMALGRLTRLDDILFRKTVETGSRENG